MEIRTSRDQKPKSLSYAMLAKIIGTVKDKVAVPNRTERGRDIWIRTPPQQESRGKYELGFQVQLTIISY